MVGSLLIGLSGFSSMDAVPTKYIQKRSTPRACMTLGVFYLWSTDHCDTRIGFWLFPNGMRAASSLNEERLRESRLVTRE